MDFERGKRTRFVTAEPSLECGGPAPLSLILRSCSIGSGFEYFNFENPKRSGEKTSVPSCLRVRDIQSNHTNVCQQFENPITEYILAAPTLVLYAKSF